VPSDFQLHVPREDNTQTSFTLKVGEILYVLGANGTGKSSLVSHLFNQHSSHSKRISAHRQTWFESDTLDITPRNRQTLESNFRAQDVQSYARYRDYNPSQRSNIAIFDLIDADTMQERKIAGLLRANDDHAAKKEAMNPSPLQVINELMRLSNLAIEISLEDGQKIVARKNGGNHYSVAELSDGERNAFLIAADVLVAKPGSLIIIDEPERHLHRSIISPLLTRLFDKREDCAFVVSTHELNLPMDTPEASTLLVRGCKYHGQTVQGWTVDMIRPGVSVDEHLKRDLLGARRKMLFVEGTAQSLDKPLYGLLFPEVSVIPKESCRDVEHAVKGLRNTPDMHWIAAWGLVDNDQRSAENIARLRGGGVWALSHYSVEALYYHPLTVSRVAARQAQVTGASSDELVKAALADAVVAVKAQRDHLVTSAVLRTVRDKISTMLPKRGDIVSGVAMKVEIDVPSLRAEEESKFDKLIDAADWGGLLTRYPLRESAAFDRLVAGIKITNQSTYRAAVLKLLHDDADAIADMRSLLGDLYAEISS
jgi:ABC-type cobalamin/Fe3+-siderophores transport system ATPase subunit